MRRSRTWQAGLAVLTIGLLPVVAYLSLGLAGRPAGLARAAAAFAIAAVGLWLEPVAMTLLFGQINLVPLALVVGDLALPDRFTGKGIGIGLAAGIKLTPLIFIPYLLFTRRVSRGGQRADLRGHGRTWVRAVAARLRGLLGGQFFGRANTFTWTTSPLTAPMIAAWPTPGRARTRTGWWRRSPSASPGSGWRCWRAGVAT